MSKTEVDRRVSSLISTYPRSLHNLSESEMNLEVENYDELLKAFGYDFVTRIQEKYLDSSSMPSWGGEE